MFKQFLKFISFKVLKLISPFLKSKNMYEGIVDIINNIVNTRFNTYCKIKMTSFHNESPIKVTCTLSYVDGKYLTFSIEYYGQLNLLFDKTTITHMKELSDLINPLIDGINSYEKEIKGYFQKGIHDSSQN